MHASIEAYGADSAQTIKDAYDVYNIPECCKDMFGTKACHIAGSERGLRHGVLAECPHASAPDMRLFNVDPERSNAQLRAINSGKTKMLSANMARREVRSEETPILRPRSKGRQVQAQEG